MKCECCGREINAEKEDLYKCSRCGQIVCSDCLNSDYECDDCVREFEQSHGFVWGCGAYED